MRFPVSPEIFKGTHFTAKAFYETFFLYLNIVWKHKCLIQVSWQQVNGKGIIVEIVNTDCMADLTCEGAIVMNSCQMDEEVNFR